MTTDDMDLVREFARNRSEEAFASLVSRHINLVFSVALREVRDPHTAQEVAQTVFTLLAQKAESLAPETILSGWLWRAARNTSANVLRSQRRRQQREQQAFMQAELNNQEPAAWLQIEPLLETAMAQLGEKDHDAVVLRFIDGRSFKEVSAALGTTEAAAKMRVNRALEKLRQVFSQRGFTCSVTVIAAALAGSSVQAAPAGLATTVTAAAIKGVALTASTLTLTKPTLSLMASVKLKIAVIVGALTLLTAGTATVVIKAVEARATKPTTPAPGSSFAPGFATPNAALQSLLLATSQGDWNAVQACFTPEEAAGFAARKFKGKSDDEIKSSLVAMNKLLSESKITQTEVTPGSEVNLHIQPPPSAEHPDHVEIVMLRKIGAEWKFAGEGH